MPWPSFTVLSASCLHGSINAEARPEEASGATFSAGQNKGASSTDQARLKERYRQKIKGLRLIDDEFMTRVFDGYLEGASLLVKTILGLSDLKITEVKTQRTLKSLQERSLRLDIHAMDSAGRIYNVEVQRADSGAPMATMRRGWL